MAQVNFWKIKKEDLFGLCDLYSIPYEEENFDRKEIIPILTEKVALAGQLTGAVSLDAEGNEVDITKAKETFNIVFYQQEGAPKHVFLGVNGHFLYLPREVNLRLPMKFMSAIKDAVQQKVIPKQLPDGKTKGTTTMRVPRFSYQILPD